MSQGNAIQIFSILLNHFKNQLDRLNNINPSFYYENFDSSNVNITLTSLESPEIRFKSHLDTKFEKRAQIVFTLVDDIDLYSVNMHTGRFKLNIYLDDRDLTYGVTPYPFISGLDPSYEINGQSPFKLLDSYISVLKESLPSEKVIYPTQLSIPIITKKLISDLELTLDDKFYLDNLRIDPDQSFFYFPIGSSDTMKKYQIIFKVKSKESPWNLQALYDEKDSSKFLFDLIITKDGDEENKLILIEGASLAHFMFDHEVYYDKNSVREKLEEYYIGHKGE